MPIEDNNISVAENDLRPIGLQLGYQPSLDGLRGIAILVVMAFNGHLLWMKGGFIGVDIFFVLSGFLITSILVQEYQRNSSISLKKFYVRRVLRLFPALFVLVLFCIGYAYSQPIDKGLNTLKGVLYSIFYIANWVQAPPTAIAIGPLSHTWSLSVEEQFYIVWPILLLVLLKLKSKGLVLAILCSLIVISVISSVLMWNAGVPPLRMYFGSDTRSHELLIGCVAALILSWGILPPTPRLKRLFHTASTISIAGILLSLFTVGYYGAFVYNGGFTLVCLGTAILIIDLVLFPSTLSRLFSYPPLVWIGKISYGLYLWHFPVFGATKRILEGHVSPFLYEFLMLIGTFLVATASYYLLELPFLRLRRRYDAAGMTTNLFSSAPQIAESS